MKANAESGPTFERTVFPEGVYPMTLKKAFVMWGKPNQYAPEGAPKIAMIWEYKDEDGNPFELMDFLTFPKNFAYNDKSNFWKRVSEIAGMPINKENVGDVDLDLGEFIQSYDELIEHIRSTDSQGKAEKADVKGLTIGDQQLLGKKCQLVVKVWNNNGQEGNNIASVMQIGATQKPLKPQRQASAAQAAPQSTSKPPARPAPAPTAAEQQDLPF
ncbi:hypothetical protein [Deinococcus navajonensis]|uniref:Single-stranded DNA-binding protein n=1 Tax=Deinococcus navajonensis TaxID=309884 RepID=A0ABV8XLL1_9DEIO